MNNPIQEVLHQVSNRYNGNAHISEVMSVEEAKASIEQYVLSEKEALLFEITEDLYELFDQNRVTIAESWEVHRKYLEKLNLALQAKEANDEDIN